jgi:hypothetical protein
MFLLNKSVCNNNSNDNYHDDDDDDDDHDVNSNRSSPSSSTNSDNNIGNSNNNSDAGSDNENEGNASDGVSDSMAEFKTCGYISNFMDKNFVLLHPYFVLNAIAYAHKFLLHMGGGQTITVCDDYYDSNSVRGKLLLH